MSAGLVYERDYVYRPVEVTTSTYRPAYASSAYFPSYESYSARVHDHADYVRPFSLSATLRPSSAYLPYSYGYGNYGASRYYGSYSYPHAHSYYGYGGYGPSYSHYRPSSYYYSAYRPSYSYQTDYAYAPLTTSHYHDTYSTYTPLRYSSTYADLGSSYYAGYKPYSSYYSSYYPRYSSYSYDYPRQSSYYSSYVHTPSYAHDYVVY